MMSINEAIIRQFIEDCGINYDDWCDWNENRNNPDSKWYIPEEDLIDRNSIHHVFGPKFIVESFGEGKQDLTIFSGQKNRENLEAAEKKALEWFERRQNNGH